MLKDVFTFFSENRRNDLRVWLKMKGRTGDRMVGEECMEEGTTIWRMWRMHWKG